MNHTAPHGIIFFFSSFISLPSPLSSPSSFSHPPLLPFFSVRCEPKTTALRAWATWSATTWTTGCPLCRQEARCVCSSQSSAGFEWPQVRARPQRSPPTGFQLGQTWPPSPLTNQHVGTSHPHPSSSSSSSSCSGPSSYFSLPGSSLTRLLAESLHRDMEGELQKKKKGKDTLKCDFKMFKKHFTCPSKSDVVMN